MKYVIAESRLNNLIEKFIIDNFPVVHQVSFKKKRVILGSTPGNPKLEMTVVEVILDNSENKLSHVNLRQIQEEITSIVDDVFGLKIQEYGSEWSFTFGQLAVVSINTPLINQ